MRSPVHPEGLYLIGVLAFLGLISTRICRYLAYFFGGSALLTAFFFRDPEREIPSTEGAIVAPADGTVLGIDQVAGLPLIEGAHQRVTIFLSVFNVHINRAPIEGKVVYRHFQPGKFYPANMLAASTENEQNTIIIDDNGYKVMIKQIAGIIARRIVCWVDPGMTIQRGERFGLIRFGSRTELFLPMSAKIQVKAGDSIQGGATIIGTRF